MRNYRAITGPNKGVAVEVWPVAVDDQDQTGIWLLDVDAWRVGPVPADATEWDAALALLQDNAARPAVLHQTSTRDEGPVAVHSFVAVVELDDYNLTVWPRAQPITQPLLEAVPDPIAVGPTVAPLPTHFDVLRHGIRHLALLARGVEPDGAGLDAAVRSGLTEGWLRELALFSPALASLYAPRRVIAA